MRKFECVGNLIPHNTSEVEWRRCRENRREKGREREWEGEGGRGSGGTGERERRERREIEGGGQRGRRLGMEEGKDLLLPEGGS